MQSNNVKDTKNTLTAAVFGLLAYIADVIFILRYGRAYMDSDIASEFILATTASHSRHLFLNPDWYYSTELRVIHMQPLYWIGYQLFPDNWAVARAIGMAIALFIAYIAVWQACKICGLGKYSLWLAGFSICPIGFWYQWQTIFGGFYLVYVIISFVSLWAIVSLSNSKNKKTLIAAAILMVLFAFLSGAQGIRLSMVFFVPLLVTTLYFKKKNERLLLVSLGAFLINAVGLLLNMSVLKGIYTYEASEQQTWGNGNGSWITSIRWYLESFGFCQHSSLGVFDMPQDIKILSVEGISIGFGFIMGCIVLAAIIYNIVNFKHYSDQDRFLVLLVFSMLIIISFVFTYIYAARQYWQQTVPFGFVLVAVALKNYKFPKPKYASYAILGLAGIIVICSVGSCISFVKEPYNAEVGVEKIVDYLLDETDYRQGYAPFWLANTTEAMSNGQIEMYDAENLPESFEINKWLQLKSHEQTAPDSHYFLLVYASDRDWKNDPGIIALDASCIYDDGQYYVFAVE